MALAFSPSATKAVPSVEAGSDPVRVPEAGLLHGADFLRSGLDLKLVAADGGEFLIVNYFAIGNPPHLVAPNGTSLDGHTVSLLAGSLAPAQYAQAGSAPAAGTSSVGKVTNLEGEVTVQAADGSSKLLKVGDLVFQSDVITTGKGGLIGITLVDGTVLSLQESGKLVLTEVVYDQAGSSNSALLNVLEGTFSLFAGKIAPTGDMKIQTPIATMGIRGTSILGVNVNSLGGRLALTQDPDGHIGFVNVFNNLNGDLFTVLNTLFSKITLTDNGMLLLSAKSADELAFDQQLTQLLHDFVPQSGPEGQPQPQSGPPSFFDSNKGFQDIIFEGAPSTPENQLLIPSELLIPLIETLLQDENIQRAIIEAIDEQPDAGSIELQPIAENDLTVVGPDTPEVESSLPFSFGSSGAGKVGFQSLDGQPVVSNGQPVTLNGQPLTYSWDAGTNTLTAMAGQTPIFSLTVDPVTGNFTLTLLSQVDHPLQGADVLQLELDFTVVAANGQQATGSLIVNVADDVPVAMNDQAVVTPEAPSTNVVLMIDRSMSEADFNLAKSAAMALVMAAGVSQVLIVDFAGNVHDSGWMSASAAESYIDGLDRTGGGTDLDGALLRVIQEYFGADSADATYMYALSNGGASTGFFGIGGDHVGTVEEIAWKLFLAGVGVDGVFGYTLGGNGASQLAPVGWVPNDPFNQQLVQELNDNQQLADHLSDILGTSLTANGNVLCNDDTGADVLGSGLVSVEFGGVTFSFDGSNVGEPQQHPFQCLHTDGARLSLQTDQGVFFTFYFADQGEHSAGDWSYMAPAGSGSLPPYENIRYTMNDGDGDTSTASLTIITDSNAVNGAVVAGDADDNVIEGDGLNTDVLVGNLGSDTFVLNSGDIADYIADYRFGEDDRIDLNHLLSGLGVDESNISDFIHIVDNGDGAGDALMVDVTGQGNFQQATTVAYLDSSAGVNIVVDDMTAQVNASNNTINV